VTLNVGALTFLHRSPHNIDAPTLHNNRVCSPQLFMKKLYQNV